MSRNYHGADKGNEMELSLDERKALEASISDRVRVLVGHRDHSGPACAAKDELRTELRSLRNVLAKLRALTEEDALSIAADLVN